MTGSVGGAPTIVGMARLLVRAPAFLLATLGVVLALGCGAHDGDSVVAGDPIDLRELTRSASSSAEAASGRFAFRMDIAVPGSEEPFAFSGEGAFDVGSDRAYCAVDMSSLARLLGGLAAGFLGPNARGAPDLDDPSGWRIEAVRDGDVSYVRFPAVQDQLPSGKSWIRSEGDGVSVRGLDVTELEKFASTDPRDVLDTLHAVSSEIELVGSERLRGAEVTHYRATVDPAGLAVRAARDVRADVESLVDQITARSGLGEAPLDVWIDGEGLVRKLALTFSATEPGASEESSVSISFELWDYGEQVDIDLPPESEVVAASVLRR